MADFGHLSDTDDSAVEELISQAQDLSVLQQLSVINSSGFTHSDLPLDLESRFRKLKSFPLSNPKSSALKSGLGGDSFKGKRGDDHGVASDEESKVFSSEGEFRIGKKGSLEGNEENPDGKLGFEEESRSGCVSSGLNSLDSPYEERVYVGDGRSLKKKAKSGSVSSPSDSSNSWLENLISSPYKEKEEREGNSKPTSGSLGSPHGSSNSFPDSPSPPPKPGCFWCSPKKTSKKKSKENWDIDWGSKSGEFLSDLNTFSVKEQQRILKKAMKEEEKINREAEKIVKWAKQASARMSFHDIDDLSSDDNNTK